MNTTIAGALVLAAGAAAAAQPAMGTFAADPEHGRILRYTMSGGPRTVVFAEGPPLVAPAGLCYDAGGGWRQTILVADAGSGAVLRYSARDGAFLGTVVAPGAGGLVRPVDVADEGDRLLVLDGVDGTVRRYDDATGRYLGVAVAPRGEASSMHTGEERVPPPRTWRGRISIAYPQSGEVLRFDAPTGEFLGVIVGGFESARGMGPDDGPVMVVENHADPRIPNRVISFGLPWGTPGIFAELPAGVPALAACGNYWGVMVSTGDGVTLLPFHGGPRTRFPASHGHTVADMLPAGCYANCDTGTGPGVLDIFDFLCFQYRFAALDPYACNCDTTTGMAVCDVFDFLCFQNWFEFGC